MALSKKIDEIDAKILKDLLKDGRKPFTEIAKEAGVTEDVIWQHYTSMKKEGIIVGATIQANYQSLGYIPAASFFIAYESQKQDHVLRDLQKIPRIECARRLSGSQRIWAIADFGELDEVDETKQVIRKVPFVLRVETDMITGIRNMPENLSVLSINETSRANGTTELRSRKQHRKNRSKNR